MLSSIQIGTILTREWPPTMPSFDMESEPYIGTWSLVKALDGSALDRNIRDAGWHFFFLAAEIKVLFLGSLGAKKVRSALKSILGKVSHQDFNGVEVTGIVAKTFLGVPYGIVSAHCRHVQRSCYLDSAEVRRTIRRDANWARG